MACFFWVNSYYVFDNGNLLEGSTNKNIEKQLIWNMYDRSYIRLKFVYLKRLVFFNYLFYVGFNVFVDVKTYFTWNRAN